MANPIIRNEAVRDAKLDNTSEYLDELKDKEKRHIGQEKDIIGPKLEIPKDVE